MYAAPPLPPPHHGSGETAAAVGAESPPPAPLAPHYHVSGPQRPLHGPENGDITLLLSLDMTPEQLQSYYDDRFKRAEAPALEREGRLQSYQARFTRLRADIDCGDGRIISCKPMEGYPSEVATAPGVMMWRWNVAGVDDDKATGSRTQAVHVAVLGASDAAGQYQRIDTIPDIPLQVNVDPLTTIERLLAAWTHLAGSLKALLVAITALIAAFFSLKAVFKKPPAAAG